MNWVTSSTAQRAISKNSRVAKQRAFFRKQREREREREHEPPPPPPPRPVDVGIAQRSSDIARLRRFVAPPAASASASPAAAAAPRAAAPSSAPPEPPGDEEPVLTPPTPPPAASPAPPPTAKRDIHTACSQDGPEILFFDDGVAVDIAGRPLEAPPGSPRPATAPRELEAEAAGDGALDGGEESPADEQPADVAALDADILRQRLRAAEAAFDPVLARVTLQHLRGLSNEAVLVLIFAAGCRMARGAPEGLQALHAIIDEVIGPRLPQPDAVVMLQAALQLLRASAPEEERVTWHAARQCEQLARRHGVRAPEVPVVPMPPPPLPSTPGSSSSSSGSESTACSGSSGFSGSGSSQATQPSARETTHSATQTTAQPPPTTTAAADDDEASAATWYGTIAKALALAHEGWALQ